MFHIQVIVHVYSDIYRDRVYKSLQMFHKISYLSYEMSGNEHFQHSHNIPAANIL